MKTIKRSAAIERACAQPNYHAGATATPDVIVLES
jgi:hypothetical protein